MPPVKYDELQVDEETPSTQRNYKKLGLIAGAIVIGCILVVVLAVTVPNSGKSNTNSNKDPPFFVSANLSSFGAGPAEGIPCLSGTTNSPANCKSRIVRCGTTPTAGVKAVIPPAVNHDCKNPRIYVDEIYIVQYYDSSRTCWEIKMAVGECWGPQPKNPGSIYSCQGKCGAGCGNIDCGSWGRDCLRHDVCSWAHSATGGAGDANCGESYKLAEDDWWGNCNCNGSGSKDKSLTNRCP